MSGAQVIPGVGTSWKSKDCHFTVEVLEIAVTINDLAPLVVFRRNGSERGTVMTWAATLGEFADNYEPANAE